MLPHFVKFRFCLNRYPFHGLQTVTKNCYPFLRALLFVLWIYYLFPEPTHAYLDPLSFPRILHLRYLESPSVLQGVSSLILRIAFQKVL